ncbi:hypothetical protein CCMA1212_003892 [Trichoderma ghanense]|uniref:Uncharacterized protein n=1 Tax=Trichoderma ghanense TaxID=65468 RepID=A0ABY2HAW0_9HYPO
MYGSTQGTNRLLTLARKLDSVHRKTVSSRKDIPSVLLAMPARPRRSRKPTAGARPSDVARLAAPSEARLLSRPSDEGITAFVSFARFARLAYGITLYRSIVYGVRRLFALRSSLSTAGPVIKVRSCCGRVYSVCPWKRFGNGRLTVSY